MSIKLPAVLGLQRALVITDARMKSVFKDGTEKDVLVFEHGIVGTQNVNTKSGLEKSPINLQLLESAKLDPDAEKLKVSFELRGSNIRNLVSVCADGKNEKGLAVNAKKTISAFIDKAIESESFEKISERYARNILNGRWLWRNKNYAVSVNIVVAKKDIATEEIEILANVSAFDYTTQHFDNINDIEKSVAKVISDNLKGIDYSTLHIDAFIDFGTRSSVEVYPSQNYCDKGNGKDGIGRSLFKLPLADSSLRNSMGSGFKIVGRAAIRDQKISNAIRTIDDWYDSYDETGVILPVEPLGASKEINTLLRVNKTDNGFKLFEKIDELDVMSKEGFFLLALLIRGGVYGSSE